MSSVPSTDPVRSVPSLVRSAGRGCASLLPDRAPLSALAWTRLAIAVSAAVVAGALLGTAWTSYATARDMSRTLARGQAGVLLEEVEQTLRRDVQPHGPPTPRALGAVLASVTDQGVTWLAVGGPHPLEVGTRAGPGLAAIGRPTPALKLYPVGDRVRVERHPPPRHRRRAPTDHTARPDHAAPTDPTAPASPRPSPGHPGDAVTRPRGGPVPIAIEFEPRLAHQLLHRARVTLGLNALVAALLVLAGFAAFRWLKRQDIADRARAREKRLATLGEMSAVLAHEIRNPLTSLKGHAQLLCESLPDGRQHDKASRVVTEAVRLEKLTTDLLAFVRTGHIQRRLADPAAIVRAAADELRAPDRVVIDDAGAPAAFSLDPERMRQVIANLLHNAAAASPPDAPIDVRVSTQGSSLVYDIRDRGAGIDDAAAAALFEPFHTDKVHGTGLGLAVARRVVDLHRGAIRAGNHPGGGAVFRIVVPGGA